MSTADFGVPALAAKTGAGAHRPAYSLRGDFHRLRSSGRARPQAEIDSSPKRVHRPASRYTPKFANPLRHARPAGSTL